MDISGYSPCERTVLARYYFTKMVSSSNQPHLLQATIIIRCANDAPHDAVANARQDHDERLTMQAEAIKQSLDRK